MHRLRPSWKGALWTATPRATRATNSARLCEGRCLQNCSQAPLRSLALLVIFCVAAYLGAGRRGRRCFKTSASRWLLDHLPVSKICSACKPPSNSKSTRTGGCAHDGDRTSIDDGCLDHQRMYHITGAIPARPTPCQDVQGETQTTTIIGSLLLSMA